MTSKDAAVRGALKRFMKGLCQEDRYILLLHHADDLTPREISLVLDVSLQRVGRRLVELRRNAQAAIAGAQSEMNAGAGAEAVGVGGEASAGAGA